MTEADTHHLRNDIDYDIDYDIHYDKGYLRLITAGAIIFVLIGLGLILTPDPNSAANTVFGVIWGLLSVGFFGAVALDALGKLRDNRPALSIDAIGVIDNGSVNRSGRIPWEDITQLELHRYYGQTFLSVQLRQGAYEHYRAANPLRRAMAALNYLFFKSPIHLATSSLTIDGDSLLQLISEVNARYT
jgi:hypothetical protein